MTLRRPGSSPVGFAEVPDFHLEVVRQGRPELCDRMLLVGGDPAKRGKLVAVSGPLRARGITEGMGMAEAQARATDAVWVRTDMRRARELSGALRGVIRSQLDAVEVEGLAGFYLRAPEELDAALVLGQRLESVVAERIGLPLRMGVAPARFAARMAAADAGRRGIRVIQPADFESYLLGQPLERFPGVGPKTAARLAELGVTDVPGLRALGLERLEVLLGGHGRSLWLLAAGQDPKPLRVRRHPTSLSREETAPDDDREWLPAGLLRLCERLESALQRDGLSARRIALHVTFADGRTRTRSQSFDRPATAAGELVRAGRSLLDRIPSEGASIRRAGLVLKGLESAGAEDRQLDLF